MTTALVKRNHDIALAGPLPSLLDTRAIVLLAAGKPDLAVRDLELAASEKPSPVFHFHKAQAHSDLGQFESAARELTLAEALGLSGDAIHPSERDKLERLRESLEPHR